jgi:NAD(P)-dependent dehydrogenase (short-subunit alcohol dehydrogenase family)
MSVKVFSGKNRMPSKLFDLSDRTCLVTGSARGLGNALAEGLAEAGATVVVTEMTKSLAETPSFDAWVKQHTPARRWGVPSDLVGTAVYLASAASDYVSGQIIFVDGGLMSVL